MGHLNTKQKKNGMSKKLSEDYSNNGNNNNGNNS